MVNLCHWHRHTLKSPCFLSLSLSSAISVLLSVFVFLQPMADLSSTSVLPLLPLPLLILPVCHSFSFSLPVSFIFIYLTKLHQIASTASRSSEYLKKILRWMSFTAPCPQGTYGLLRETNGHIVTMQPVLYKGIYAQMAFLCHAPSSLCLKQSQYSKNLLTFLLLSLCSKSYFTCCLKINLPQNCSCEFWSKTGMSSKYAPLPAVNNN